MPGSETLYLMPDWIPDAIFYQIFPDRFCNGDSSNDPPGTVPWGSLPTRDNFFGGDLKGIIEKLDYLQDLGVNALYLNPIFKAQTNHKYDTTDYFEVDPAFGSKDVLMDLVGELHRRKMRIILDGVFNHCGSGFWAFEDVKARGAASRYAKWFFVRSYPISSNPLSYYTCGDAAYLPKLNLNHRPVQRYILKVATYWLEEMGIDGWRLDVPFKISMDFWQEFRSTVKAVNPQAYLVGEIWREAGPWVQGDVFDGTTNYRLRELILDYCATNVLDAEDFAFELAMLRQAHSDAAPAMLNLLGSHDTPRIMTVFQGDVERLLIAVTFLITTVGTPLIYYGDEIGMAGETDPGCRRTMQWDETQWNHRVYETYRRLIGLRRAHPALRCGSFETLLTFNGVFAYRRVWEEDEVIIILNPRSSVTDLLIPTGSRAEVWHDAFTGRTHIANEGKLLFDSVPALGFSLLHIASDTAFTSGTDTSSKA